MRPRPAADYAIGAMFFMMSAMVSIRRFRRAAAAAVILAVPIACAAASTPDPRGDGKLYAAEFTIELQPPGRANVVLDIRHNDRALRELRVILDGSRFGDFSADGGVSREGDEIVWMVPASGGRLRWSVSVDHRRGDAWDARLTDTWGVFRGEDLIPPIASRTRRGARSLTTLRWRMPRGWSVVTPYPEKNDVFRVANNDRRFDKPTGWMVAGELGVRRDIVASTRLAVASPRVHDAHELDVLAFLTWHLPQIRALAPDFPGRLTVIMANDPMWRGGLSAPTSIYLHADRPLISGNGTSTLLHELMHVAIGRSASRDNDWIVEGLAEYYSQAVLFRAGTVTRRRNEDTIEELRDWSRQADSLRSNYANGAVMALAVMVMKRLDEEIRGETGGKRSLDDVVRALARRDAPLSLAELRRVSEDVIGKPAKSLSDDALPGYG